MPNLLRVCEREGCTFALARRTEDRKTLATDGKIFRLETESGRLIMKKRRSVPGVAQDLRQVINGSLKAQAQPMPAWEQLIDSNLDIMHKIIIKS